jgi:hypothetical protein
MRRIKKNRKKKKQAEGNEIIRMKAGEVKKTKNTDKR